MAIPPLLSLSTSGSIIQKASSKGVAAELSPLWQEWPSTQICRSHASVAAIGDNVYVTGGRVSRIASSDVSASVAAQLSLLSMTSRKWQTFSKETNMLTPRYEAATVVVHNSLHHGDEIWYIGGKNHKDDKLTSVERYLPTLRRWSLLPPLPKAVTYPRAVFFNGHVVVLATEMNYIWHGDLPIDDYDPLSLTASKAPSLHWRRFPMNRYSRAECSISIWPGHGIIAAGGRDPGMIFPGSNKDISGIPLSTIELYEPSRDDWVLLDIGLPDGDAAPQVSSDSSPSFCPSLEYVYVSVCMYRCI
jgi:hypothetical protein